MDPTRISIARILALGTRLTWREAVAVAHEAAMVSDVCEAMNEHPSLVNAETCFITAGGELELPETTDEESPATAIDLLRQMLTGLEVPEGIEALVNGGDTSDLSDALTAFPVGNRRAVIAQLAARALGVETSAPSTPVAPVAAERPPVSPPPPADMSTRRWAPMVAPSPAATPVARVVVGPPGTAPAAVVPLPAADVELRQLRIRAVERDKRNPRSSGRFGWLLHWRPPVPSPRFLGGLMVSVAATAAVGVVAWRGVPLFNRAAIAPSATPAASLPAPSAGQPAPSGTTASGATATGIVKPPAPAASAPRRAARASGAAEPAPPSASLTAPASSRPSIIVVSPPPTEERRAAMLPSGAPAAAAVSAPNAASVLRPSAATPSAPPPPTAATSSPEDARRRPPQALGRSSRASALPYSPSDTDVTAPVMLRQQLPTNVLAPGSDVPPDWPFLEVLIDERGTVERVRLHARTPPSGQSLYRHRMLVAAAKAWQFEPARRQGQAVRYALRVPLEP